MNAKIYGASLYALAESEGVSKEILLDLKSVALAFSDYPDYVKILDSPRIERSDLMMILNEDFFGRINKYTLNFIKLLCEKHMVFRIKECLWEYERQYNEKHRITTVTVTTAKPMKKKTEDMLVKKLEAKTGGKILLRKCVDESCIGGIVIETDGKRIDGSIKTGMLKLEQALTE